MNRLQCEYAGRCSGCPWIEIDIERQRENKAKNINSLIGHHYSEPIEWIDCGLGQVRDRADLTYTNKDEVKYGLYRLDSKELLDLKQCPLQTDPLASWYQEFRSFHWPVERGSFRLRVSPEGQRGVWLDFSNVSVKSLFDEKQSLLKLLKKAHVEIGQRRKVLKVEEGELKLKKPIPMPWFETYIGDSLKPMPLYCSIGDFTQASFQTNKALIKELLCQLHDVEARTVVEVGAGIGNLTLPLAEKYQSVEAYELDKNSYYSLEQNIKSFHKKNIKANRGDIFKKFHYGEAVDLLVVDPPRSGFMKFFTQLLESSVLPRYIGYVSCFPESYANDLDVLSQSYELVRFKALDQFPNSPHAELISLLKRRDLN